jgi:FKBP-type peptidyl-prolyl cis-trans isomerase 2
VTEMPSVLVPGLRVRHPAKDDWGTGQIQSVIGNRVTVNFEHAGKVLINSDVIDLIPLDDENGGA